MSLQVWLPCDGDLRNRGLAGDFELTTTGTAVYGAGKIGEKAIYADMVRHAYIVPELTGVTEHSICAWIKIDPTQEYGASKNIIAVLSKAGNTQANTVFEMAGVSDKYGYFRVYLVKDATVGDNTNGYLNIGGYIEGTEWTHVALAKNADKVYLYINGSLLATRQSSEIESAPQTLTGLIAIGESTSTKVPAWVNDLRIYDHCLSAKEVAELAKGLVYHYPLSMPGMPNIFKNTLTNFPSIHSGSTMTKVSNVSVPEWGCTDAMRIYGNSGTSSVLGVINNYSHGIDSSHDGLIQIVDNYYTFSMYIKNNHTSKEFRIKVNGGSLIEAVQPNETKRVIVTRYVTSSASTTYIVQANLQVPTAGDPYDITFWHPKMELGDHATPWMPAPDDAIYTNLGFDNDVEYDVSGYGRNGTKVDNPTYTSDTARYTTSVNLNGTSQCIQTPLFSMENFSVALWFKRNATTNTRQFMFTGWPGFSCELKADNKPYFRVANTKNENSAQMDSPLGPTITADSGWVHFCGVYTYCQSIALYINGEFVGKTTISSDYPPKMIPTESYVGRFRDSYFNGKISDCRIYATALSADDVMELYKTSASLTNNGVLMTSDVVNN